MTLRAERARKIAKNKLYARGARPKSMLWGTFLEEKYFLLTGSGSPFRPWPTDICQVYQMGAPSGITICHLCLVFFIKDNDNNNTCFYIHVAPFQGTLQSTITPATTLFKGHARQPILPTLARRSETKFPSELHRISHSHGGLHIAGYRLPVHWQFLLLSWLMSLVDVCHQILLGWKCLTYLFNRKGFDYF